MVVLVHRLIPEEQDLVSEQQMAQGARRLVRQRGAEIDPTHFGADPDVDCCTLNDVVDISDPQSGSLPVSRVKLKRLTE